MLFATAGATSVPTAAMKGASHSGCDDEPPVRELLEARRPLGVFG